MERIDCTVVAPVYRNAATLPPLFQRLSAALASAATSYEIIFVDDACPENSLAILEDLASQDSRVGVIALSQNVGQQRALIAALKFARGNWVVVMDADLQDPPEFIPTLLAHARANSYAAIFAGRRGQYESSSRLLTSRIYKWLLHVLTGIPADAGIFLVMNRKVADRLLEFDEPFPNIVAMIGCTGLPTLSVPMVREPRPDGQSAYTSKMRIVTALRAIAMVVRLKWFPQTRKRKRSMPPVTIKTLLGARFVSLPEPR